MMTQTVESLTNCDRLVFEDSEVAKDIHRTLEDNNISEDLLCDHEDFPFCDCLAKYAGSSDSPSNGEYLQAKENELYLKDWRVRSGANKRPSSCRSLDSCSSARSSILEVLEEESEVASELGAVAIAQPEEELLCSSVSTGGLLVVNPGVASGCRRASIVTSDTRSESLKAEGEPVRIAVFGKDGVGKSALIVRLVTGRFIGEYDPSMEAIYNYQIPLSGYPVPLQVMDTAGKVDAEEKGRESQVSWGEGYLLVFSLTNRDSLTALQHIRRTLVDLTPGSPRPLVLVGNKADLCQAREVTSDEILDLASVWGCDYFETSAAEPWEVVVRPFAALYEAVMDARDTLKSTF